MSWRFVCKVVASAIARGKDIKFSTDSIVIDLTLNFPRKILQGNTWLGIGVGHEGRVWRRHCESSWVGSNSHPG